VKQSLFLQEFFNHFFANVIFLVMMTDLNWKKFCHWMIKIKNPDFNIKVRKLLLENSKGIHIIELAKRLIIRILKIVTLEFFHKLTIQFIYQSASSRNVVYCANEQHENSIKLLEIQQRTNIILQLLILPVVSKRWISITSKLSSYFQRQQSIN
jgi:hypothetical protein